MPSFDILGMVVAAPIPSVNMANGDGIWILRQHLAEDPEVEKAYANYVMYYR